MPKTAPKAMRTSILFSLRTNRASCQPKKNKIPKKIINEKMVNIAKKLNFIHHSTIGRGLLRGF